MPKFLAFLVAVLIMGGVYFYQKDGELPAWLNFLEKKEVGVESNLEANDSDFENVVTEDGQSEIASLPISNFEECIAAGNRPLADAPDKCLTQDGHVFIKGVLE